ncbi:Iron-sulfur cluster assembly protein SufD [Clostridiaceae bacterium JG1575]|nr:Iron-sulfur cluster assembly protein SufD [Clostridiaceae bacterium JG1575]
MQVKPKEVFNELPRITFRWVRANDLKLDAKKGPVSPYQKDPIVQGQSSIQGVPSHRLEEFLGTYQGTNATEMQKILAGNPVSHHIVSGGEDARVHLRYDLDSDNPSLLELNLIEVREGETLHVIQEYRGSCEALYASTLTLISVASGGALHLTKINHLPYELRHIEQRYARVFEGGAVHYQSVELGGEETIIHYETDLLGREAKGDLACIYGGHQGRILDLSHQMNHYGECSFSDMDLRGVLSDRAKKTFRGTLDFKKGAAQSEGGEVESVLLLHPQVKSFAIPLLLCAEHDVVGNHAASAGQIDEDKLFYLMSRGFSQAKSRRMIVESSLRPLVDRLPTETLREEVLERLGELLGSEAP